mmetsp:Transcript_45465/g.107317  ORF Transcript_45465/g.107317 Transcript_45465/m.107317 type:complete len:260 (+) Transcript_45465:417-1196(+)
MGQQPVVQLAGRVGHEQRAVFGEGLMVMGAKTHADAGHAGVGGQLQIVRRVTDHQRALGLHAELAHQLQQHLRVGLGAGLVGGAGGIEHLRELGMRQHPVQAHAVLAGCHGQPVVAGLQRLQHLDAAVEQRHLVLGAQVVVAVAQAELAIAVLRQARHHMLQRVPQAQANDVFGALQLGLGLADVHRRALDAACNQRGRVEQGAVPVEGDQVKTLGAVAHYPIVGARGFSAGQQSLSQAGLPPSSAHRAPTECFAVPQR